MPGEGHLKIETVWSCPVCGESAMGVYDGSSDVKDILEWVQTAHGRMNPDCPYKFRKVELHKMDPDGDSES